MESRRTSTVHTSPPPRVSTGPDHGEEMLAELDEPPDDKHNSYFWTRARDPTSAPSTTYTKAQPPPWSRRESLLTRGLHSEVEHPEDEDQVRSLARGLSMVSTWSNQSTTSTAELTSDDGRSMPSPAGSPPLPPTQGRNALPITEKPLSKEPQILGLDAIAGHDKPKDAPVDKSVEAGLGRKRCITFACGNKDKVKQPTPPPAAVPEKPASPPRRKCMIKFACPTRAGAEKKAPEPAPAAVKRASSPPPPVRRPIIQSRPSSEKVHRGSDSTVTHASPKNIRRGPPTQQTSEAPGVQQAPVLVRRISNDSDDSGDEGTRFHEFATSEEEPEDWIQESTCHRMRLTINDTLKKENVIRQLAEEVEEEALEDEEADLEDDEDQADENDDDEDGDDEDRDDQLDDEDEDEDDESDAGFHSDDEQGFAVSDSEDDGGSDNEWWKPGGISTAATSTDQLENIALHIRADRVDSGSSISSMDSGRTSLKATKRRFPKLRRRSRSKAVDIDRLPVPDLPDSTDFVCGTLDEDRPIEQAYINCMKQREAAKHKPAPQDIDPTFPTSDPEMDEEDDEDLEDPEESESEAMVHGDLEELHGTARRRSSPAPRRKSRHSPPPPARHKSPAPVRRRSPAPVPRHKSPAPRHRSPAPKQKSPAPPRRSICRSPPPPAKREVAHSPTPLRKLFGQSPKRRSSPAPGTRMTSPPNTRRSSPTAHSSVIPMHGLAARPSQITHTASLPRNGGFLISRMARLQAHEDENVDDADAPKRRGAIDIVKGLEKKRQRRKEKLHQKACAKAVAKGEKQYKVKPGKGCERMREVGLELQRYKGKGEHILSV